MSVNNSDDQLIPLQVAIDKVTEAGFLNNQFKEIRATSMLLSCRRLGAAIGATQPHDGYHWYIDLKKFTEWLSGFYSNIHIEYEIEGTKIRILEGEQIE